MLSVFTLYSHSSGPSYLLVETTHKNKDKFKKNVISNHYKSEGQSDKSWNYASTEIHVKVFAKLRREGCYG